MDVFECLRIADLARPAHAADFNPRGHRTLTQKETDHRR